MYWIHLPLPRLSEPTLCSLSILVLNSKRFSCRWSTAARWALGSTRRQMTTMSTKLNISACRSERSWCHLKPCTTSSTFPFTSVGAMLRTSLVLHS